MAKEPPPAAIRSTEKLSLLARLSFKVIKELPFRCVQIGCLKELTRP
jgi:hypothetical protein